jgi:hypothetical protein
MINLWDKRVPPQRNLPLFLIKAAFLKDYKNLVTAKDQYKAYNGKNVNLPRMSTMFSLSAKECSTKSHFWVSTKARTLILRKMLNLKKKLSNNSVSCVLTSKTFQIDEVFEVTKISKQKRLEL